MTIDQLEALELAAAEKYDLTEWSEEHLYEINGAVMNAIPKLLAVAKAAKWYCGLSHAGADTHDAYLELWEALSRLEAQ